MEEKREKAVFDRRLRKHRISTPGGRFDYDDGALRRVVIG
jgi:hypothetical protein